MKIVPVQCLRLLKDFLNNMVYGSPYVEKINVCFE